MYASVILNEIRVRVRVIAIAEGYAIVRRPGCTVFVVELRELLDFGLTNKTKTPKDDIHNLFTKYCPCCEKETTVERIFSIESIEIKGEKFKVPCEYYKCMTCGGEYENGNPSIASVELAMEMYDDKHSQD
jgi:hypothetical protein